MAGAGYRAVRMPAAERLALGFLFLACRLAQSQRNRRLLRDEVEAEQHKPRLIRHLQEPVFAPRDASSFIPEDLAG
jgi:hypothetical protein